MAHKIENDWNLETALEHEDDPVKRAELVDEFYAFIHHIPLEPIITQEVA